MLRHLCNAKLSSLPITPSIEEQYCVLYNGLYPTIHLRVHSYTAIKIVFQLKLNINNKQYTKGENCVIIQHQVEKHNNKVLALWCKRVFVLCIYTYPYPLLSLVLDIASKFRIVFYMCSLFYINMCVVYTHSYNTPKHHLVRPSKLIRQKSGVRKIGSRLKKAQPKTSH